MWAYPTPMGKYGKGLQFGVSATFSRPPQELGLNMQQTRPPGGPLHTIQERTNAAHADAHSFYHTTCPDRCESADRRAAQLMISPQAFLTAAKRDLRIDAIAEALYVTPAIVEAYIRNLPVEDWLRMRNLVGGDPHH